MTFTFPNVLVLGVRMGTSKAGNPWASLSFLDDETLNVYDVMQFGDAVPVCSGVAKGARAALTFEMLPGREGGVRLNLVRVGSAIES